MKTVLLLLGVIAVLTFTVKTTVAHHGPGVPGNTFADAGRIVKGSAENTANGLIQGTAQAANDLSAGVGGDTQKAIAGDLDLKMLMMEDGSSKGKCYCSCNLNNQPVFMELDSSNLSGAYAVV